MRVTIVDLSSAALHILQCARHAGISVPSRELSGLGRTPRGLTFTWGCSTIGFGRADEQHCEHRHARPDLRRRRHRRVDRLLPELPRGRDGCHRAHRRGLRGLGQVGRFPGARLVRRQPAPGAGAQKLRPARRACPKGSAATGAIAVSPPSAGQRAHAAARAALGTASASTGCRTVWSWTGVSARWKPRRRCIHTSSPPP